MTHAPSLPPLKAHGQPHELDWMGLQWSPTLPLELRLTVPPCTGLYKLLDAHGALFYIGESANLRDRIKDHARRYGGQEMSVSYSAMPSDSAKCQRLELESDLIGANFDLTQSAPGLQFQK